jgi:hypothetical protein
MSDKKNIVIKVKYPTPGKPAEQNAQVPGTITEWNFKRIGFVLAGLFLGFLLLLNFGDDGKQPESPVAQDAPPEAPAQSLTQQPVGAPASPAKPDADLSHAVVRSQLTSDIDKNEPVDTIAVPIKIGFKETLWIYYFAELKGLKGKTILHEWLLNGELVSQKKVNISADPWRTASKQMITYTTNNDWSVRLTDEAGNKLIEKKFNLELK